MTTITSSPLRRTVLVALVLTLLDPPLPAEAQRTSRAYRVGFLGAASAVQYARQIEAMRKGLRDLGYAEGRNLAIEYRWAEGQYERLHDLAIELVRLKVDVIVTHGTPGSRAAKQATTKIPIVMVAVGNPDETGLVQSVARPGGNITGTSFFFSELNAKRLQVLKDAIPGLARVAALTNSGNPAHESVLAAMKNMARNLRVDFHTAAARRPEDIDAALGLARKSADAVAVIDDGMFIANAQQIVDLAARHQLPTIGSRELADAGGLIAYGVDFPEIFRQSMTLVDRILKGADPGNLPILQASRFELVVNLKTARALGLTIPPSLLLRADQRIE
ncbi:MAG TPA: ABC transporter substrate-binding protein [Methylomirabilota bacterium]|nr:ABC transporter substrate-binding protein [Methylomirabilota bacterium]